MKWAERVSYAYFQRGGGLLAAAYQVNERSDDGSPRHVRFVWAACAPEDAKFYGAHEQKILRRYTADMAHKRFLAATGRDLNYYQFTFTPNDEEGQPGLYIQVIRQIEDRLRMGSDYGDWGERFTKFPALNHEDATDKDYLQSPGEYYWDPRYDYLRPLAHKPKRMSAEVVHFRGKLLPRVPEWFI